MPSLEDANSAGSNLILANADKQEKRPVAVGTNKMTLVQFVGDSEISFQIQNNMTLVFYESDNKDVKKIHG